uniref:C1q domain-containing protein n=1 Tax=Neolamprologus brichardi TaxID=32507 RepID=A0A3Q4N9X3_NEOBR
MLLNVCSPTSAGSCAGDAGETSPVYISICLCNNTNKITCSSVSSQKIHFFASYPAQINGKLNRIKYSKVLVNVGRAFDRRTGVFRAPVKGIYQFFFSTQTTIKGLKTDLWLVINNYWVAVSQASNGTSLREGEPSAVNGWGWKEREKGGAWLAGPNPGGWRQMCSGNSRSRSHSTKS